MLADFVADFFVTQIQIHAETGGGEFKQQARIFLQGEAAALLRDPVSFAGDETRRAAGQPDLAWLVEEAIAMEIDLFTCQSGMALVGMAAFFGATVRAPLTGMVVVTEMTATTETLVPMMAATGAAVLVAYLVGSPPIYESLRERMPDEESIERRGNA